MYNNLASDFDEMLNLSKDLRERLSKYSPLDTLNLSASEYSSSTGTTKYLFTTGDERKVEAVLIPEGKRNTLCVSTQVGCPLDCKFCATGLMGYKRNLTPGEILDQYILISRDFGKDHITNLVYMGMGEPLLNFENTINSVRIFTNELNKVISKNRITISTAGIPPNIIKLGESGLRVKLALSLHSCFEEVRTKIMPINKKYSLRENLDSIMFYLSKTKTRITFEYTMLRGINDRKEDISALVKLCRKMPSKINIIPFNSIKHMSPGGLSAELEPTSKERIDEFVEELRQNNLTVLVRETQGDDIAAACGQLAARM